MPTANDLTSQALEELGIIAPVETMSAEQARNAFIKLNQMVDAWPLEPNWLTEVVRTVVPLTVGVTFYTIGPGATINLPRPPFGLINAGLIIDTTAGPQSQTELPIQIITDQAWAQNIQQKGLPSTLALGVYYDFSFAAATGFARVWPWPVTSAPNTALVLYTPGLVLSRFATPATNYLLPPGYELAIRYNLALELAPGYGRPVDPKLETLARKYESQVLRANTRTPTLRADECAGMSTMNQYGWNYRTGTYSR